MFSGFAYEQEWRTAATYGHAVSASLDACSHTDAMAGDSSGIPVQRVAPGWCSCRDRTTVFTVDAVYETNALMTSAATSASTFAAHGSAFEAGRLPAVAASYTLPRP